jgi:hypothetical protein
MLRRSLGDVASIAQTRDFAEQVNQLGYLVPVCTGVAI